MRISNEGIRDLCYVKQIFKYCQKQFYNSSIFFYLF